MRLRLGVARLALPPLVHALQVLVEPHDALRSGNAEPSSDASAAPPPTQSAPSAFAALPIPAALVASPSDRLSRLTARSRSDVVLDLGATD